MELTTNNIRAAKTGDVNASKIGAVNKLTFEPIISARSGGGLNFQLSPNLGSAATGRKFSPLNIAESHQQNPESSEKSEQKKIGEHSPPALGEIGNGPILESMNASMSCVLCSFFGGILRQFSPLN